MADPVLSADDLQRSFDRYARMVRRTIDVPVALVTVVEAARQVFVGAEGLPEPWHTTRETPLTHSFCQYVVGDAAPLVISDARVDPRLGANLAIPDIGVVAYAGYPIAEATGTIVGSLCAIDTSPRDWKPAELEALHDIAATVSTELSLRQLRHQADRVGRTLRSTTEQLRMMLTLSTSLVGAHTVAEVVDTVHAAAASTLGCSRAAVWLVEGHDLVLQGSPALAWPAGVAGRVALAADLPTCRAVATGDRLLYADRRSQDRDFPAARGAGPVAEARAFLPLFIHGAVTGCLVLLWPEVRDYDEGTVDLLRAISAYTAQALDRARLLEERTGVAITLQRALLSQLPQPETLQIAARYRAAAEHDEVGGDWYDALVGTDGATYVAIGDVIGHDVAAASVMGQLRNMLRALVWQNVDDTPAGDVARLDHLMRDLQIATIASLVLARVEQSAEQRARGERTVRWTNAGHPPPLLLHPSGQVTVLTREPADTLLGVLPDRTRSDHTVDVGPGSTLLLYTDGLVEDEATDIRDGIARLSGALAAAAGLGVEELLDTVLDAVLHDPAGARQVADDVAVLAVRFDTQ